MSSRCIVCRHRDDHAADGRTCPKCGAKLRDLPKGNPAAAALTTGVLGALGMWAPPEPKRFTYPHERAKRKEDR